MTSTPTVDLEKWHQISKAHFSTITPYYDQGRAFEKGQPWVEEINRCTPVGEDDWVLDAGTGTGLFAAHFAGQMPGHVIGMDPSAAMLKQAQEKQNPGRLGWVQGMAETLPLAGGSLRVAFLSQVWHHLDDQERAGREFFRCLKPGGGLYIKTFSHQQLKDRWDLQVVFPELLPLMLNIYPDLPELTALLEKTGFAPVTSKIVRKEDSMRPSHLLNLLRQKAWSMFSYLSPEGTSAGKALLKSLIDAGDAPVPYPEVHLLVVARR